ncbi:unnamed protein product [Lymnaea stagnalis]|uniref:RecA family profile 1 domain-containing protein n=1 Tax=Lymnaea stagnalis TaxID=6523 RepID=A0AAV2I2P6_LYMST
MVDLKMQRKTETGTQLLARLSTRVDLSGLDPLVFGSSPNSPQSLDCKLIEISGLEGIGKTELALHYIARTCLPCQWKGLALGGLGAKVTVIDTEFKFSVLRLAIVIECLVLRYVSENKLDSTKPQEIKKTSEDISLTNGLDRDSGESDGKLSKVTNISKNELEIPDFDIKNNGSKSVITPHDMENIVHDALERVDVMKVTSSQQLVVSLLSLEQRLSCDPQVALIVIDSISAFYWMDQAFESSMAAIVQTILRCRSEFGVSFLLIKSLLINPKKRKWEMEGGDCSESSRSDSVEFLGRHWASLSMRKIILSESTSSPGRRQFLARCPEWSAGRHLSFVEDCLLLVL